MPTANRLKQTREAAGLTQQAAAWNARVTLSYYRRVEAGGSMPTLLIARQIARALGVDVDTLWPDRTARQEA